MTRPMPSSLARRALVRWYDFRLRHGRIDRNAYYDRLTDLVMASVLEPGAVCVDVGCHAGAILRRMMHHAPGGTFLAFEPLPHLHAKLVSGLAGTGVRVYDLALSDARGVSSFNHVISNPGYSGLRKRRYDRPSEIDASIEVRTDTLDEVLAREPAGRVSFVKIDVEGAEYLVLKGASQVLRTDRPHVVFEHGLGGSDRYGKGPDDVFDLLRDACGLRVSLLSDWLLGRPALDRRGFRAQFDESRNYYFLAHP